MSAPVSSNKCSAWCSCFDVDVKQPNPEYKESKAVTVAPISPPVSRSTSEKAVATAHIRFESTEQVSLTTALRQHPPKSIPSRYTHRA